MSDGDLYYLGRVERRISESARGPLAHLRPLYEADPAGRSWRRRLSRSMTKGEFPNRGLVAWFNPPPEVAQDTLWQFRVEEQPTFDLDNPHHDQFKVAAQPDPQPPHELVDLRYAGSVDGARLLATEQGIRLSFIPAPKVFLQVTDEYWLGPVRLVPKAGHSDLWVIDPDQARQPLRRVTPLDQGEVTCLDIDGKQRLLLGPRASVRPLPGQVDWAPDEDIVKRVLRALRRLDPAYTDAQKLTSEAITHYIASLHEAGPQSADYSLERSRLERARTIVAFLQERKTLLEDVATEILRVPAVAEQVRAAKEDAQRAARQEIAAELAAAQERLQELQTAVERARQELQDLAASRAREAAQLEQQFAARRAELEQEMAALEDAFVRRLETLLEHPGELLAGAALLRGVFTKLFSSAGMSASSSPGAPPPAPSQAEPAPPADAPPALHVPWQLRASPGSVRHHQSLADLRPSLGNALRARGLPGAVARPLHAAFVAGAMPVLAGCGARDALAAYAQAVTGGRVLWLPVSPAILAPVDLLGRVDPATRRFIPAPGGLVDLLLHAQEQQETLFLVALDGINLAAVEAYLTPLLACATDAWHAGCAGSAPQRALPLLHPGALAADDPYLRASWLAWPPNVLLAGTLAEGAATVPLPRTLWTSAVLIHLERFELPATHVAGTGPDDPGATPTDPTEASLATWCAWREESRTSDALARLNGLVQELQAAAGGSGSGSGGGAAEDQRGAMTSRLAIPSQARALAARFLGAAQAWRNDAQAADEDTLACCLAPWLIMAAVDVAALEQQRPGVARALTLVREVLT